MMGLMGDPKSPGSGLNLYFRSMKYGSAYARRVVSKMQTGIEARRFEQAMMLFSSSVLFMY